MNDLFNRMGDPNGAFVRHFQGDGFHSRVFELACFAYISHAGLTVDRLYPRPDFLASSKAIALAMESVTANPPSGQATDISLRQMADLSGDEIYEKVHREFPNRMGNILSKKLAHNYHDAPQCKGKPLVFMVAPFFEAGAVFYPDDGLISLLFGSPDGVNEIFPFFHRPEAQPVSAVIYCNPFTVPKFLRLATDLKAPGAPKLLRQGTCYLAKGGDFTLRDFRFRVGTTGAPKETWAEGITIFKNPNASVPLPDNVLPSSCRVCIQDDEVYREVRGFHPLASSTHIYTGGDAIDSDDRFLTRDHMPRNFQVV